MKNILLIKSSLNGELSKSNQLAEKLITQLTNRDDAKVVMRDLATNPLEHLSQVEMRAWMTPEPDRTSDQKTLAEVSDSLIKEVNESDTLVIAMPMYNFGVPSTFKAWVDRIARAGITFKYTEQGPVGLLTNKKVIIVATRGGMYQGTEKDSQSQFLKDFFTFIGINDLQFIYAEGLNMPDGEASFARAKETIERIE